VFTDAVTDASGAVWISSLSGALRINSTGVRLFTEENGLLSNGVHRVMVDREGIVWFGTEFGLSKLVSGPFALLDGTRGLPSPFVRALAEAQDGSVWAGTREGAARLDGEMFRALPLPPSITDPRVYALSPAPEGGMLVGTRSGLVHYAVGGEASVYQMADGLPADYVSSLSSDGVGVWVGTAGGVARWERGSIRPVADSALANTFVVTSVMDASGRVWMGRRSGGLFSYDGDSLVSIGPAQGLTDQTIWSVGVDDENRVWAGTNGDGVYRLDGEEIVRLTTSEGLINDFVWQVLPASDGSVWLYTSQGLDQYKDGAFVHYGRADGLLDLEGSATAALEDSSGRLWFGSGSGLYRYEPSLTLEPDGPPPVYIEGISVGGHALAVGDVRIPPGSGVVSVRFSSPSFRHEGSIRFSYRIPELGPSWSEPTPENAVNLAGLGPGGYTLEVVAVGRSGTRSPVPATVGFSVLPRPWQTLWFRALAALLVLGGVASVPSMRARKLEAERNRLELLVGEHTREIEEKTARLVHEAGERVATETALRESEQHLHQAQKMEVVGQLAGGIAHDFNNLLTSIVGNTQLLAADLIEGDPRLDDLRGIDDAAQRGALLVSQLLAFGRRELVAPRLLDLNDALQGSAHLVDRLIGDKIVMVLNSAPQPAVVRLDPTQLTQVFVNLALNARDAMPSGGEFTVSVGHERPAETLVVPGPDKVPAGPYVTVTVADAGSGMDPQVLSHVFEPFFTTKEVGKGTGLGLSTVFGIVHQSGGYLHVRSRPEEGTEFKIFLPDADGEAEVE